MLTPKQKEYWYQIHQDELEIPDLVEKHLKELRAMSLKENQKSSLGWETRALIEP